MLMNAAKVGIFRELSCALLSPLKRESKKHEKLKVLVSFPFPVNTCKGAAVPNS